VEAGHRCSIPTCRHLEVEIHHIIPWADCKEHEYDNLIALCPNCHKHAGDEKIDRKSLRLYKLNLRFVHDKYSQLEMDILFELFKLPTGQSIQWPAFNNILLKRIIESDFIEVHEQEGGVFIGGMRSNPDTLTLTNKGREFLDDLGVEEL